MLKKLFAVLALAILAGCASVLPEVLTQSSSDGAQATPWTKTVEEGRVYYTYKPSSDVFCEVSLPQEGTLRLFAIDHKPKGGSIASEIRYIYYNVDTKRSTDGPQEIRGYHVFREECSDHIAGLPKSVLQQLKHNYDAWKILKAKS